MDGLKVLITNAMLAGRTGTELYVRDVALRLLALGHTPIVYSTNLGQLAGEIRDATIPVVDNLDAISTSPDIIHGHHTLETMTALLRFPNVPAVYFCHDWYAKVDSPPQFPRILRYVAVDQTCHDKLVFEHAISEDRVRMLFSFVDLERFKPRPSLPAHPKRALLFSNHATEDEYLGAIRKACARMNITLDVLGENVGKPCARPEALIGNYDIVFAKGRSALEAVAVGTAVVLYCMRHVGPMVTTAEFDRLLPLNFGIRAMSQPLAPDLIPREIEREIARYDPVDAAEVSRRIRATAGLDSVVDEIIALYKEVIVEQRSLGGSDIYAEGRAAAAYMRGLQPVRPDDSLRSRLRGRILSLPALRALARSLSRNGNA